ncbi:hypothetical protein ABPG75_008614 [Micractinium tetrahymenae]
MKALSLLVALLGCVSACTDVYTHTRGRNLLAEKPACSYNHELAGRDWPSHDEECDWTRSGKSQSPINIPMSEGMTKNLKSKFRANLQFGTASNLRVLNLGHAVQVEFDSPKGNKASVVYYGDSVYTLYNSSSLSNSRKIRRVNVEPLQFHFHSTSEHLLSGRSTLLEFHLVTKLVKTCAPRCACCAVPRCAGAVLCCACRALPCTPALRISALVWTGVHAQGWPFAGSMQDSACLVHATPTLRTPQTTMPLMHASLPPCSVQPRRAHAQGVRHRGHHLPGRVWRDVRHHHRPHRQEGRRQHRQDHQALPKDCDEAGRDCVNDMDGKMDLSDLFPSKTSYFAYTGSLTTPPCSEGVMWHVFGRVKATLTEEQALDLQTALSTAKLDGELVRNRLNNRVTQPWNDRTVFVSM